MKNNAGVGDKTTDSSATVKPGAENGAGIKKEVVSYSNTEVSWKITATIPAVGLDKCEIEDAFHRYIAVYMIQLNESKAIEDNWTSKW